MSENEQPRRVVLPDGHTLTVAPDEPWTALFRRTSGWSGADGIYAMPLSGDESPGSGARTATVFVFGDTFIGDVEPGGARRDPTMVNNTLAILEGADPDPARVRFLWRTAPDGRPSAMIVPRTPRGRDIPDSYYWLQDGAVVGRTWYCFPMIVGPDPTGPEGFQFAVHGVTRVSVPVRPGPLGSPAASIGPTEAVTEAPTEAPTAAPTEPLAEPTRPSAPCADPPLGPLTLDWPAERQADTPLFFHTTGGPLVYFGAAVFPNTAQAGAPRPDGFVYVYGLMHTGGPVPHSLVAARAPEDRFEDFASWRFWDGAAWCPDSGRVDPIAPSVSPECSVSPLVGGWWHGRYALTCQLGGQTSLYLGDTPVGPFADPIPLYRCPEPDRAAGVYVYNAKAHPHLSRPGELLVSYNVNTTKWDEHLRLADIYRPRFLRVRAVTGRNGGSP